MYVCQTITFKSLDIGSSIVHICTSSVFPGNMDKARVWRSSGQGQGHMTVKGPQQVLMQWMPVCICFHAR